MYIYDAKGSPIGMQYRTSSYAEDVWDVYWFEKNLQGDIVAVYSYNGTLLISYKYDAWGNTTTTYSGSGASTTAVNNSITYRGYYYDKDLGLYYLQARYYDPAVKRFINADGYVSTGSGLLGYNMFAYCGNNPVNRVDYSGDSWIAILGLVAIGALVLTTFTSSNDDRVSEEEQKNIDKAVETADAAEVVYKEGEVVITYSMDDFKNIDSSARHHFYNALYQKNLDVAKENQAEPMSYDHIRWEAEWHLYASYLNIPNAEKVDLNTNETRFSMIQRGAEYFLKDLREDEIWFLPDM